MRNLRPKEGRQVLRVTQQKHTAPAGSLGLGQAEGSRLFPLRGWKCSPDVGGSE